MSVAFLPLILLMISCNGRTAATGLFDKSVYEPEYASGFNITGAEGKESVMVSVKNPWQGADNVTTRLFIARNGEKVPAGFDGQILSGNAERIVTLSSSHVAMLDAIGESGAVVGVSGIGYITNPDIQSRRADIGDIGYEGNIDYELLVALEPDLVLLYGVSGASEMEGKLKELKIPFLYVGDYLEENPLGKAEWVVAIAELMGKRATGIGVFDPIVERYNKLKEQVTVVDSISPKVMVNTPYGDSWFMPSTNNYISRLIHDAGGKYVYTENNSNSSMPIDLEEAYILTSDADCWINVGTLNSLAELKQLFPKFADTKPVVSGEVYNSTLRTNAAGGNDFWESGIMNPDVILNDLIKIFHPEAAEDTPFYYYKKLE